MSSHSENPAGITSFFLCDDVRIEDNHKQMYIGVYSESVVLSETPTTAILRPVILMQSSEAGIFPVWCQFSWPGIDSVTENGEPVRYTNEVHFEYSNCSIAIPLPPLPVVVSNEGEMVMETSKDGKIWEKVSSVRLSLATA